MSTLLLVFLALIWLVGATLFIAIAASGGGEPVWWEIIFWPVAAVIALLR